MTEAFLHHIWKFRLFNSRELETTDGERVEVIRPGQHNTDAGPDFFNAQVKIGTTTWAGNVEIHQKSSEWNKHQHTTDSAYNNVVLHVVYEHDEEVFTQEHIRIVTVELKGRFDPGLFNNYLDLIGSSKWIPCEKHIGKVDAVTISSWLERMLIERLEIKSGFILDALSLNKNNWEETFYQQLARNFGFYTNSLPFEILARSVPLQLIGKHKDQLKQIEALLFGQSGLLNQRFADSYGIELRTEYEFLRKKYSLVPMDAGQWKFLRLRPSNFPTIRMAQLAQLMHKSGMLFSKVMETDQLKDFETIFSVGVSPYWTTHYTFDKLSPHQDKSLGESGRMNILINTVIPLLFAYGRYSNEENYKNKAISLLEEITPEENAVISQWKALGITSENAARTQSLLHLKNTYCNLKKCLFCSVGNKIINTIS
jgi:hypothetical protein